MTLIRKATPGDAQRIAELYQQLVNHPAVCVQPERIAQISTDHNTALLVCEYQGLVQGSALVSLCADVMFGAQPFAVVENVIISAEAHHKGLGTALMRHIEALCLGHNCSKIMLLSSMQREQAHRFFAHCGFAGSAKRGFVKYRSAFEVPT